LVGKFFRGAAKIFVWQLKNTYICIMKNEKEIKEAAYELMVMLGEIKNEMERGGETATEEEISALYEKASVVYQYFEN
jgi:hypothetical protein